MIEKIKTALNNSIVWVLSLIGVIAYLWLKERDLENKLEEEKVNGDIKADKEAVKDADANAADAIKRYNELRDL